MKSVWIGMTLLTDCGDPEDEAVSPMDVMLACLELAESAFRRYDKDGSDTLGLDEFVAWARSSRAFMLQVEQFRLIAEKAIGFEEELSLPDGSDEDSDLDDEFDSTLPVRTSDAAVASVASPLEFETQTAVVAGSSTMPPAVNFELDWVYGTNGPRSRNACQYLHSGEIVYAVANVAVVYASARHEQRYYRRHRRFIQCLDVNESGEIVATADGDGTGSDGPEIHVWNGRSLQCLAILRNFHEQGVLHVAFPAPKSAATSAIHSAHAQPIGSGASTVPSSHLSKKTNRHTETLLASVGSDANASMALWNWQQEALVSSGRALGAASGVTSSRRLLAMALSEDGDEIVVCGTHFVLFHQVDGRFFKQKKPQLLSANKRERATPLLQSVPNCLCVAYYGVQDVVVGTARGELLRFQQRKLSQVVQAHERQQSVTSALLSYRSMILFTAGKDGQIKQWDSTLRPIGSPIDLHVLLVTASLGRSPRDREAAAVLQNEDFRVSSLAYDARRHQFLVATRHGNVIEFSDEASSTSRSPESPTCRIVASGHTTSSLTGTATANTGVSFASFSSRARCLKLWCLRRRMCTAQLRITTFDPTKLAFSNDSQLLLVGGHEGSIMLLRVQRHSLTTLTTMKNTSSAVTALRFAPDDQLVAVGRANGLMYIYHLEDGGNGGGSQSFRFKRYALLKRHQISDQGGSVASIDFSADGSFLRVQVGGRLAVWDLRRRACTQVVSPAVTQSVQWQTSNGSIPDRQRQGDSRLRFVASRSKKLALVMDDGTGDLGVADFPFKAASARDRAPVFIAKVAQTAHLAQGNGAERSTSGLDSDWALRDSYVISCSQNTAAICQWRIEDEVKDVQPRRDFQYDEGIIEKLWRFGLHEVYFGDQLSDIITRKTSSDVQPATAAITVELGSGTTPHTEAPDLDLLVFSIQGFNCERSSINAMVACSAGGRVIYSAGTLLVHRHLQGRSSPQFMQSGLHYSVSCLVRHPSQPVLAVGSREDGKVVFFDDNSSGFREVATISSDSMMFGRSLISLSFLDNTANGDIGGETDLVAVVWKDKQHTHSLAFYSWSKSLLIASAYMTQLPVTFGEFTGLTQDQDGYPIASFVSGGVDHVVFWQLNLATRLITSQQGVFGRHALVQTVLSAVYIAPFVVTGTEDGSLIIWNDGIAAFTLAANSTTNLGSHKTASNGVVALIHIPSRSQVIGGMCNGEIMLWQYEKTGGTVVKPNAFLQLVRSSSVFSLQWSTNHPISDHPNDSQRPGANIRLVGLRLIEESSEALAVLSSGQLIRLELNLYGTNGSSANSPLTTAGAVAFESVMEVQDVALHPREALLAACLADGSIRVWDLRANAPVTTKQLTSGSSAIGWSPSGKQLAVATTDGSVAILNGTKFEPVDTVKCEYLLSDSPNGANHHVTKLKYSPAATSDGSASCLLALAGTNYSIYVYSASEADSDAAKFALLHTFVGHTAPIASLDFSIDGKWLQSASTCRHRQLLRWSVQPDDQNNSTREGCELKDDQWVTWTATLSGPVAGLEEVCGANVSALCRIHGEQSTVSARSAMDERRWRSRLPTMAVGTDQGEVLLSWYPFTRGTAGAVLSKEYRCFFSADSTVLRAEFSVDNEFLVTLGRDTSGGTTLIVWKTDYEEELRQLQRLAASTTDRDENRAPEPVLAPSSSYHDLVDDEFFKSDDVTKGDEFLAVKPWTGAVREPSTYVESSDRQSALPNQELRLEFAYGVNTCATASNCAYYADDSWEIVYTSASLGIVYNTKTQTQLLHQGHGSNAISALAVHPRGDLVVTGDSGIGSKQTPTLILWDANSGSTMAQISTVHARGVLLLGFAPSGERFASVGMEDDHSLAIYALVNGGGSGRNSRTEGALQIQLLISVKTSKQRVWGLCLNDDMEAVTCGEQHILFFQDEANQGGKPRRDGAVVTSLKRGLFSSHKQCNSRSTVLQAVFFFKPQTVVSSQADGSLYLWKDRRCVDVKLKAHSGAIPALALDRKRQLLFSAGRDGKICSWNTQLENTRVIDLGQLAAESGVAPSLSLTSTKLQSLAVREGRLLVATMGSEICEVIEEEAPADSRRERQSNSSYRLVVHVRGHTKGEVWGLAVHPSQLQFATAGDDGSVRLWDAPTRSALMMYRWEPPLPQLRALAFSSDGNHLAVGTSDGRVRILLSSCDTVVTEWKCGPHGVRVLKYSPDNELLAIGGQDRRVHLLDARTYHKVGELSGHSAAASHMDFSRDGSTLQTVSVGAGELLFWDVRAKKQITSASAVRDTQWATWSCPFGWPVQGVYPPESDGSDVNAVARSRDQRVVAVAGDDGTVKLFQYPCVTRAAPPRVYAGHASHVTNCAFSAGDSFLLTTGGRDQTVCQFRYVGQNGANGV